MGARFYSCTRDLHLHVGLFLSPFVLLFAASVVLLNHPGIYLGTPREFKTTVHVEPPFGIEKIEGMERVKQARQILSQAGLSGEIGFIRYSAREGHLIIPISRAGYDANVDVALDSGFALITQHYPARVPSGTGASGIARTGRIPSG